MLQYMQLPLDADDEDVTECCCDSPCTSARTNGWFCPSRISIARKCPGTGQIFKYPKGQTVALDWFVYSKISTIYIVVQLEESSL